MKKYLLPLFLMLATAIGFTSCSDDDDEKSASVAISLNGEAVENNAEVELAKGTVLDAEGTAGEDDIITLNIQSTDSKNIKNVQVTVNNSWESNVAVTDIYGSVLNDKFVYLTPSTEKTIRFVGVYGEYTVKITTESGSKTYKFTAVPEDGNLAYDKSDNRYLSNKQTIVFDSENSEYANKIINLTYAVTTKAGKAVKNFGNAKLYTIDAAEYANLQGSKGSFYISAGKKSFDTIGDLTDDTEYLIYQNGKTYYLMHIVSIEDNILTAEIQY